MAIGSATALAKALAAEGIRKRRGPLIDKGIIYKMLNNRAYVDEAVHKGTTQPGEHEAIGFDLPTPNGFPADPGFARVPDG